MENNKKILIPTIVAVATLILLVFGATYAYFTIESTNNFGTKELNATVEDMADAVVLEQVESTLSLDVTRVQMSEDNAGTTYYASGSSTPANIAKISTTGEGTFTCTYKVSVTKSATNDLYTAFQGMSTKSTDQIYLSINDSKYDFNTTNLFPITYNGTINGVSKDTPQYITANLALLNKNVNQNDLKGKDITLTFSISDFNCELDTIEYIELAFTYDYLDDIGYEYSYFEDESEVGFLLFVNSDNIEIPAIFQGDDGIWYKVTSIAAYTFEMSNIKSIKIPDTISSIGDGAFSYSSLVSIYIPKDIALGEECFVPGITNIYYAGSEEEWNELVANFESEFNENFLEYIGYFYGVPTMHYNVNY